MPKSKFNCFASACWKYSCLIWESSRKLLQRQPLYFCLFNHECKFHFQFVSNLLNSANFCLKRIGSVSVFWNSTKLLYWKQHFDTKDVIRQHTREQVFSFYSTTVNKVHNLPLRFFVIFWIRSFTKVFVSNTIIVRQFFSFQSTKALTISLTIKSLPDNLLSFLLHMRCS